MEKTYSEPFANTSVSCDSKSTRIYVCTLNTTSEQQTNLTDTDLEAVFKSHFNNSLNLTMHEADKRFYDYLDGINSTESLSINFTGTVLALDSHLLNEININVTTCTGYA